MGKKDFDNSRKNNFIIRIMFLLLILLIICLLLFYLSKGNKIENNLLKASKDYYNSEDVLLPSAIGDCAIVTLEQLLNNDYIKNEKLLNKCDKESTYVKVCKLESGKYHYTPIINCKSEEDTLFGDWKIGYESDLVDDKSDIRFSYLAQIYSTQVKKYYPNNENNAESVQEYYASLPSSEYKNSDSGVKASKWYIEEVGTTYWNDGALSSVQPNGYPTRGAEGNSITSISLTKPAEAGYRTISEITLYKAKTVTKPYPWTYICYDSKYEGTITSTIPCESRSENNYNKTVYVNFTCDGVNRVNRDSVCTSSESDWSTSVCVESDAVKCETTQGYRYIDKRWQWYNTGTYRKYYPSGSRNSNGEITYYTKAPINGAIEDKSTTTTVYRYYKLVDDVSNTEGKWIDLNENYLGEDELISLFNENGFNVKSLEDIMNEKNIRYTLRLEYSNRK